MCPSRSPSSSPPSTHQDALDEFLSVALVFRHLLSGAEADLPRRENRKLFLQLTEKKSELPEIRTLAKVFASLPISSPLQENSGLGRVAAAADVAAVFVVIVDAAAVVIVVSVDAAADDEEDVENQMR